MKLAFLILLAVPAHAQVIQLDAGSSTLYQASGLGMHFHFPNSETYTGLGYSGGHFHAGFFDEFKANEWSARFGDDFLGLTAASSGISVPVRGVSLIRRRPSVCPRIPSLRRPPIYGVGSPCSPATTLRIFFGATGAAYTSPFFQAVGFQNLGAGIFYEREMRGLTFTTLNVIAGQSKTSLWGIDAHGHGIKVNLGGGLLQNAGYWNGEVSYQASRHAILDAAHSTYIFEGRRADVNSIATAAMLGPVDAHGTWLFGRGETYGLGVRLAIFRFSVDRLEMRDHAQTFGSLSERIGRRFQITEYVSAHAPSIGVEYQSNRFSAGFGWTELFYPFLAQPFQRTASVHIGFRIRDSLINTSTLLPPRGKMLYSIGGTSYFAGPLQNTEQVRHAVSSGKYLISGRVLDSEGNPVAGAAIVAGKDICYSDSEGNWSAHVRKSGPYSIKVSLDDFAAVGDWKIVSAPATASPGTEVSVVIERER